MTRNDALAHVVRLACLTEDRDDAEQRALVSIAWECDKTHNRATTTNRARQRDGWKLQNLVAEVDRTRVLDAGQKPIGLPKGWAEKWNDWES